MSNIDSKRIVTADIIPYQKDDPRGTEWVKALLGEAVSDIKSLADDCESNAQSNESALLRDSYNSAQLILAGSWEPPPTHAATAPIINKTNIAGELGSNREEAMSVLAKPDQSLTLRKRHIEELQYALPSVSSSDAALETVRIKVKDHDIVIEDEIGQVLYGDGVIGTHTWSKLGDGTDGQVGDRTDTDMNLLTESIRKKVVNNGVISLLSLVVFIASIALLALNYVDSIQASRMLSLIALMSLVLSGITMSSIFSLAIVSLNHSKKLNSDNNDLRRENAYLTAQISTNMRPAHI